MSRKFKTVHVQQEPDPSADPYEAFNSHFRNLFESGDPSLPPWTHLVAQFVPKRYHVFVQQIGARDGPLIPFQYTGENTTVFELKKIIRYVYRPVPLEWQILFLEREPPLDAVPLLDDEQTMEHYNVQDGDVIHIFYF